MASGDGSGSGGSSTGADLPIGVERALTRATRDPVFRADLRKRRAAAAEAVGIELTAAERAVLEAIDDAQLAGMVDQLEGRVVEIPAPEVVAPPAGIRPDHPMTLGIRPETIAESLGEVLPGCPGGANPDPTRGSRPDAGMVKGIRPGLPIALAAGAVMVGGVCATLCMTAGSRPDEPPEPEPTEPQVPPGESQADEPPDGGTPDGGDSGATSEQD